MQIIRNLITLVFLRFDWQAGMGLNPSLLFIRISIPYKRKPKET